MWTRWISRTGWGGRSCVLWVASVDFREDVVGSEQLMQRIAENYRKIRNTFRYVLGNLYDFDPQRDAVPFEKMEALDQYMLRQTAAMAADVTRWYDEFAFHRIYQRVHEFLCGRTERILFRCAQRPAVHLRAPIRLRGGLRRRRSGASARRWFGCWLRS